MTIHSATIINTNRNGDGSVSDAGMIKSTPSNVSSGRQYTKVQMEKWTWIPIIMSLGIFYLVQNHLFQKALFAGDLDAATKALKYGARTFTKRHDILNILENKKIESIKFLAAQIDFSKWSSPKWVNIEADYYSGFGCVFFPGYHSLSGLYENEPSYEKNDSALELIAARDDHDDQVHDQLVEILPFSTVPRTYAHHLVSFELVSCEDGEEWGKVEAKGRSTYEYTLPPQIWDYQWLVFRMHKKHLVKDKASGLYTGAYESNTKSTVQNTTPAYPPKNVAHYISDEDFDDFLNHKK